MIECTLMPGAEQWLGSIVAKLKKSDEFAVENWLKNQQNIISKRIVVYKVNEFSLRDTLNVHHTSSYHRARKWEEMNKSEEQNDEILNSIITQVYCKSRTFRAWLSGLWCLVVLVALILWHLHWCITTIVVEKVIHSKMELLRLARIQQIRRRCISVSGCSSHVNHFITSYWLGMEARNGTIPFWWREFSEMFS